MAIFDIHNNSLYNPVGPTFWEGYGVKAIPGSIPVPNPGSLNKEKKENIGRQMGTQKYMQQRTLVDKVYFRITSKVLF
jgi:hypothetical protein